MRDSYGFTPPESFGAAEWEEVTEAPGEAQHDQPHAVEDAPEPTEEEAHDYTDTAKWIRVETPVYIDGATLGQATAGLNIKSGETRISYRLRTPDEEGLDHVVGEPFLPVSLLENKSGPTQENERDSDWKAGISPQMLNRFLASQKDGDEPSRPDAMSYQSWMRTGFAR